MAKSQNIEKRTQPVTPNLPAQARHPSQLRFLLGLHRNLAIPKEDRSSPLIISNI
jgi:hypothetical protein